MSWWQAGLGHSDNEASGVEASSSQQSPPPLDHQRGHLSAGWISGQQAISSPDGNSSGPLQLCGKSLRTRDTRPSAGKSAVLDSALQ